MIMVAERNVCRSTKYMGTEAIQACRSDELLKAHIHAKCTVNRFKRIYEGSGVIDIFQDRHRLMQCGLADDSAERQETGTKCLCSMTHNLKLESSAKPSDKVPGTLHRGPPWGSFIADPDHRAYPVRDCPFAERSAISFYGSRYTRRFDSSLFAALRQKSRTDSPTK